MTLDEIISKVYTETNRPDKVDATLSSVLSATLELHLRGRYLKDLKTATVIFDCSSYVQTLDTHELPLYRNMAFMRSVDDCCFPTNTEPRLPPLYPSWWDRQNNLITPIEADDIFDINGYEKVDVMYQAGHTLYIRSSKCLRKVECGWIAYPSATADDYQSWIADEVPWAIIYKATSLILAQIGKQDMARTYDSGEAPNINPGKVVTWLKLIDENNTVM